MSAKALEDAQVPHTYSFYRQQIHKREMGSVNTCTVYKSCSTKQNWTRMGHSIILHFGSNHFLLPKNLKCHKYSLTLMLATLSTFLKVYMIVDICHCKLIFDYKLDCSRNLLFTHNKHKLFRADDMILSILSAFQNSSRM